MQEIKKNRIVLASVLKPVDEPRMFERLGQSLATNGYEVFIIGQVPASAKIVEGVHFVSHNKINRISTRRIMIRFKILKKIFSIRPNILIVTTHELLGIALLYKLLTRNKIVYDVQENYCMNLMHTHAWPQILRWPMAMTIRLKETFSAPFISKFILAENCYSHELFFTKNNSVVVENKCRVPTGFLRKPSHENIKLIFTGTLAESTGIFQAIALAKKLYTEEPLIRLKIVGYCPMQSTLKKIHNEIRNSHFITITGGDEFVSHEVILKEIASAHFGIVYYPHSPHTINKIPSKLYEYLACQLPILLQPNPKWINLCQPHHSCIVVDFGHLDTASILSKTKEGKFYPSEIDSAKWPVEEATLIACIKSLN
ncbi:MAG: hypothetical protein OJF59_003187 [Cytophagales bacterium]|jgi:glycosyltransferase involved in cell wall biosynthesis|nr:hypothetical protein [Bacteroidota bacterium]MBS1981979.1 hypothetical protein [Bacteroidota bacterium]WHZ09431.1 MAG: hypothetical protein OJF59_003187 [Cytophagales bacterium]